MKAQNRLLICVFGLLFPGLSLSQSFTIDSIRIDEIGGRLSIYSKDLDFSHAVVFVTDVRLYGAQPITGGFRYDLPDSGNGSAGNISIFSGGRIDSNWSIMRWKEDINYIHKVEDSVYYSNQWIHCGGPNFAYYPHVKRATYHFVFRAVNKVPALTKEIEFLHLNRATYVEWNFDDQLFMHDSYAENYFGNGILPGDVADTANGVFLNNDSIIFSYTPITGLPCSFFYMYEARSTDTIAHGNTTSSLEKQHLGLKMADSVSVNKGSINYKTEIRELALCNPHDSAMVTLAWSRLSFESPYTNPGNLMVSRGEENKYSLSQNYPNPFPISTTIPFTIGKSGYIALEIDNMLGRKMMTIADGSYEPGNYTAKFNRENLADGIFFVKLLADGHINMMPIIITR